MSSSINCQQSLVLSHLSVFLTLINVVISGGLPKGEVIPPVLMWMSDSEQGCTGAFIAH